MDNSVKLTRAAILSVRTLAGTDILNGREEGRKVFEKLVKHLESQPLDTILPLSFAGIKFLDYSCADEIVYRTISRITSGELGARFIVLQNVSTSLEENITVALNTRDVCCLLEEQKEIRVIGKISDPISNTYSFAARKGMITAGEVGDEVKTKVSASSNRLTTLERMGLIYKVEEVPTGRGGKQYVYRVVG